jgi:hypothetical protein
VVEPLKGKNGRTGMVLGTIALVFFLGVILKYVLLMS